MKANRRDTILYGGFFNPPTRAHHAVLQACIDHAKNIDADVWVLPCGNRAHKKIDLSVDQRMKYVDAMVRDVESRGIDIRVETLDLYKGIVNETYDLALELNAKYMERRFIWVFGSDSVATIRLWKKGEWLMKNLPMLIIERPGAPIADLGFEVSQLAVETSDISSTEVRTLLAAEESVDHLVTPSVLACLKS